MKENSREISIIKERILQYLDFKGISKYKFYQETGVTNGVLSQKNGISEENILRFLNYYTDISSEWLLTGKGEMLKNGEATVIAKIQDDNAGLPRIPLVNVSAVAGFGNSEFSISEADVKEYYVVPKFKFCKVDFMIEISGSSMYPKYNSGDVVACTILHDEQFIQWNKCHIIATREQGILCKRLLPSEHTDCFTAVSDNKNYPPFDIPKCEITGIALVVGVIRLE